MDENKTNLPEQPQEPLADAMAYASNAKQQPRPVKPLPSAPVEKPLAQARMAEDTPAKEPAVQKEALPAEQQPAPPEEPQKKHFSFGKKKPHGSQQKLSLKEQDRQKRLRLQQSLNTKKDPYYGLELKPLEEYQRQYEETLSFKPVRPQDTAASEMTGTFTYLFNKEQAEEDPELKKKLEKMHAERRRRVSEAVRESGASNVAKEDIFSITTAIDLKDIRKAAQEKGVPAPVREPGRSRPVPPAESRPPVVQEPDRSRPVTAGGHAEAKHAVQEPQTTAPHTKGEGVPADYRPLGTPVHIIALQDLITPVFNESREYPRSARPVMSAAGTGAEQDEPAQPAAEETSSQEARFAEDEPAQPAAEEASPQKAHFAEDEPAQPAAEEASPQEARFAEDEPAQPAAEETSPQEARFAEDEPAQPAAEEPSLRPTVVPFVQPEAEKVPDRFVNEEVPEDNVLPNVPEAPVIPRPAAPVPGQPGHHAHMEAAKAVLSDEEKQRLAEEPDNYSSVPQEQPVKDTDEELDDYTAPGDAPAIFHQLSGDVGELTLRLAVTGICSVLELIFGVLGEYGLFGMKLDITAYLICNMVFLAVAVGFCGVTILNGLSGLVRFHANADSGVAVAGVAGMIQGVAALFVQDSFMHGRLHLYAAVVCVALFLNTMGKLSLVRRVKRNFHFVTSPNKKYAVEKFDDHNTALQMAEGVTLDSPAIAYQRESNLLQNFLRLSYGDDPSDRSSQYLAPVLFCASLALFLIMLLLVQPQDVSSAFTAFAAATCVSVPIMNMLAVNLPLARLSRLATRCGGMVVGYPAVQYFSDTNAVMMDAKDLFPAGSVVLNGIKTFGGRQMDEAIVDAAALMRAAGGPLSSLFGQVVQSHEKTLPQVENVQYEDGMGIVGWVGGRRVFIGNRRQLEKHNVPPPAADLESRYVQGGKQIAYLSVSGELAAMFIVSYRADHHRALELQRAEENGISLIVRSNDPVVTAPFLAAVYGLDVHTIRVLPERLAHVYESLVKQPQDANALLATGGKPSSMLRLVTACARQRGNISMAVMLQNVASVLGFVLVAFLCWKRGMQQVSTVSLLFYELFWVLAVWLVPRIRKP